MAIEIYDKAGIDTTYFYGGRTNVDSAEDLEALLELMLKDNNTHHAIMIDGPTEVKIFGTKENGTKARTPLTDLVIQFKDGQYILRQFEPGFGAVVSPAYKRPFSVEKDKDGVDIRLNGKKVIVDISIPKETEIAIYRAFDMCYITTIHYENEWFNIANELGLKSEAIKPYFSNRMTDTPWYRGTHTSGLVIEYRPTSARTFQVTLPTPIRESDFPSTHDLRPYLRTSDSKKYKKGFADTIEFSSDADVIPILIDYINFLGRLN